MSHVSAPYRFVPLSKLVLLPDWADQVSHDQPFADGLCGELQLQLTCHTPLCVGGRQEKSSDRESGKVYFFRTPDNRLAIPGSSLKGMLRNVLEIASFARFRQVEDQKLGVRDISDAQNFYCQEMVREPSKAGWMIFADGHWYIQPCTFSRIHQAALIKHCRLSEASWKRAAKVRDRYKLMGLCPQVRFDREPMAKRPGQWLAKAAELGSLQGRIVVTGQPGNPFDVVTVGKNGKEKNHNKKYEFIFHDTSEPLLPISSAVMAGFQQIHNDSDEWEFWCKQLENGRLSQGIPVFFHKDGEQVKSLGLAMMYKLPYSHSLHDAIRHTHEEHLSERAADLPDLIFGHLGEGERGGRRGRVNIGLASLAADHPGHTDWEGPCILNSPKPTFYPAYIRQDGKGNSFRQLMEKHSELAGWKRYPVKAFKMQYPQGKKAADNKKTQVKLETVPAGSTFTTTLRFHNLRRVELGALLWALDFGGRPDHRHALGMGKPFGLGQVSLSIAGQRLRANDPADTHATREAEYLQACRREFSDLMEQTLQAAGVTTAWEKCGPLRALLEHAKPARSSRDLDYLPDKAFVKLRKKDRIGELLKSFHKEAGVTPPREFDTCQPHGYESRFAEHLEQAASLLQQQAAKAELEQREANASEEDARLLEIAVLADNCLAGAATSSQKNNLAKLLNKAHETSMDLDASQKNELRRLADHCSQIDYKKI